MFTMAVKKEDRSMGEHTENNNQQIDIDKLTKEAEAGHGHYIKSMLGQVPFEEQIRIVHEMTNLSRDHIETAELPRIEFEMHIGRDDGNSSWGYSDIQLYRLTPNKFLGRLFPKAELLYESSLNLTTGEKSAADNNR
jgi:hypothetical protein